VRNDDYSSAKLNAGEERESLLASSAVVLAWPGCRVCLDITPPFGT
jgi:hypothetical protein